MLQGKTQQSNKYSHRLRPEIYSTGDIEAINMPLQAQYGFHRVLQRTVYKCDGYARIKVFACRKVCGQFALRFQQEIEINISFRCKHIIWWLTVRVASLSMQA